MKLLQNHRDKVYMVLVFLLVATITFVRQHVQHPKHKQHADHIVAVETPTDTSRAINLGVYIENIYLNALSTQTYDADGWIWLRWSDAVEMERRRLNLNAEKMFEFQNRIDDFEFLLEPVHTEIKRKADGSYYQRFRFSGHFYIQEIDFRHYPFLSMTLPIEVELSEALGTRSSKPITLVADEKASGIGQFIDLEGFITESLDIKHFAHYYASALGDDDIPTPNIRPQIHFGANYHHAFWASYEKFFIPLGVVMMLTLISPSLSSNYWDARVGFPPMAILSLMFLQQETRADLPNLPYLTFIDMVYNACYVANMMLFIAFVWASNTLHNANDADRMATIARIDRIDQRIQIVLLIFLMFTGAANWIML